jgi:hypothetical protein
MTAADLNSADFRHLLTRAQNNEISSDRQVLIAPGLDLTLSDSQLERLGRAADRAEAGGARKAMVLIDDTAVTIDLATRVITSRVDLSSGSVLTGVDAVVRAEADEAAGGAGLLAVPAGLPPRGIAELFEPRPAAGA